MELTVVRDGQEAVEYLLRQGAHAANPAWHCPDLVLLDLNLPRLTGREVLERIRETPALRAIPVVVLTTSHRLEDVLELYRAGANTYIEKPQDFGVLCRGPASHQAVLARDGPPASDSVSIVPSAPWPLATRPHCLGRTIRVL